MNRHAWKACVPARGPRVRIPPSPPVEPPVTLPPCSPVVHYHATMDRDLPYWIAFSRVPSVGAVRATVMERHFQTMEAAWNASASELRASGLDQHTVNSIVTVRSSIQPSEEIARLERLGVQAFTWNDPAYPPLLREAPDAPPVLYMKGMLLEEDTRAVTVVGTRGPTVYGKEVARQLAGELASAGITIISGLARGIDAIAHRAALDAGGRTIAVMGSGIDVMYPPEHRELGYEISQQGALLSEYPLGTRPDAHHFPRRNRLLSGLSLGTLVIEAGEKSGSLWTVRHALEQGREVFCVPGSIYSPASRLTNSLIQEGAKLVMDVRDIVEELNLSLVAATQQPLPGLLTADTEEESLLLKWLSAEPVHVDQLSRESGLHVTVVTGTLALMELKGLAKQVGAMNYIRTREATAGYEPASA